MIEPICIRPWEFRVEPFRIAEGLYYVGNRNVSSHLINTGDGLILLDTAFPQTVYLLLESIRRLGFDPGSIVHLLHCHGHYDHFGGTRALVELTGATTLLGKNDVEILTSRPELSWAPEYGVEFHETFKVDRQLTDGDIIELGETRIECVGIPGHTPGAMSYFFDVTEHGQAYKVGIHGGPGLNTLSDDYLAQYGLPKSRREDYLRSLERLRQRHVDIFIGCHPDQSNTFERHAAMTESHNSFTEATAWPRFLDMLDGRARELFGQE